MMKIEVRRAGEFTLNTLGDYHCSTLDTVLMRYVVTVWSTRESLDRRGFLFEQIDLGQYIENLGDSARSCELLAASILKGTFDLVRRDNPLAVIEKIRVDLSPSPFHVTISAEQDYTL